MHLVLLFLTLAALGASIFPELSSATILLASFACVAGFRLFLLFVGGRAKPKNTDSGS